MVKKNHKLEIRKVLVCLGASALRGNVSVCANHWVRGDKAKWVQVQLGCVNFAYPFPGSPANRLKELKIKSLPSQSLDDWESHKYATLVCETWTRLSAVAELVHDLFTKLLGCPEDYELMIETVDVQGRRAAVGKFQVVVQLPERVVTQPDVIASIEREIATGVGRLGMVDGNDFGAGTLNVFIVTTQPLDMTEPVRASLNRLKITDEVRIVYRAVNSDSYIPLWPENDERPFLLM